MSDDKKEPNAPEQLTDEELAKVTGAGNFTSLRSASRHTTWFGGEYDGLTYSGGEGIDGDSAPGQPVKGTDRLKK